jgi:hypothetical protein
MTGQPARQPDQPACIFNIEELVLHGFARVDRVAIATAIERELGRLLSEPGTQQALRARGKAGGDAVFRSDAGSFLVPHDASPDAVGIQVARAIHRGLGPANAAAGRSNAAPVRAPPATGADR